MDNRPKAMDLEAMDVYLDGTKVMTVKLFSLSLMTARAGGDPKEIMKATVEFLTQKKTAFKSSLIAFGKKGFDMRVRVEGFEEEFDVGDLFDSVLAEPYVSNTVCPEQLSAIDAASMTATLRLDRGEAVKVPKARKPKRQPGDPPTTAPKVSICSGAAMHAAITSATRQNSVLLMRPSQQLPATERCLIV